MLYLPGLKNKMNDSQQLDAQNDFGKFNVQCESESQLSNLRFKTKLPLAYR